MQFRTGKYGVGYVYMPHHGYSMPALHRAARSGATIIIQELIDAGENVNDIYEGRTALHYAAQNSNLNAIRLLIHLGADIAIVDQNSNTARDLLNHESQLEFDSIVINLHQNNMEIRADAIYYITPLPLNICECIAGFEGGSGSKIVLGESHESTTDSCYDFCHIL